MPAKRKRRREIIRGKQCQTAEWPTILNLGKRYCIPQLKISSGSNRVEAEREAPEIVSSAAVSKGSREKMKE